VLRAQKARLARIHTVKTQSCAAFIQNKLKAEQRLLALQSGDPQQRLDTLNDDDLFQLQHHHLLSCLERTTVRIQYVIIIIIIVQRFNSALIIYKSV